MFKTIPIIVMAALCLNFNSRAQSQTNNIKPLKIGDTIPQELWNMPLQVVNHPERKQTITLNDYKGKLIILDFWATWCGACIAAMPKVQQLQHKFNSRLVTIPVAYETKVKVEPFLSTNKTIAALNLMSVYADKSLSRSFPHSILPHIVWISPKGELMATSSTEYLTPINIEKVLAGNKPDYVLKKDVDTSRPLYLGDALPNDSLIKQYSIFIKGQMDGLPGGSSLRIKNNQVYGLALYNQPLLSIYQIIAAKLLPKDFTDKRFIYAFDRSEPLFKADKDLKPADFYTYDYIMSTDQRGSFWLSMLNNLNQVSPYRCNIEKRKIKCLSLVRTSKQDKFRSLGGRKKMTMFRNGNELKNHPLSLLLVRLNQEDVSGEKIVIDETGYDGNVDLLIRAPFHDYEALRRELNRYDLDLIAVEREIEMFAFYAVN